MGRGVNERAESLRSQTERLVLAGQFDKALPTCRTWVALQRTLADNGDAPLGEELLNFAVALQSLGTLLEWTGRHPDKLAVLREELPIRRRFAPSGPEHRNELARVLSLIGVAMSRPSAETSETEEALAEEAVSAARESVDIRRELVAFHPGTYRSWLGHSLTDLAKVLNQFGRHADAEPPAAEAVEVWRTGKEHLGDLAEGLNLHGFVLTQLEANDTALAALSESIEIFEQLGDLSHAQYAGSLTGSGRLLALAGRPREATRCLIKALALAQEFGRPDTADAAAELLGEVYRAAPRMVGKEWKKMTGTKPPPNWLEP